MHPASTKGLDAFHPSWMHAFGGARDVCIAVSWASCREQQSASLPTPCTAVQSFSIIELTRIRLKLKGLGGGLAATVARFNSRPLPISEQPRQAHSLFFSRNLLETRSVGDARAVSVFVAKQEATISISTTQLLQELLRWGAIAIF